MNSFTYEEYEYSINRIAVKTIENLTIHTGFYLCRYRKGKNPCSCNLTITKTFSGLNASAVQDLESYDS